MKKLICSILTLFVLTALPAQAPVYVLFNSNCMNQLEYRNASTGLSTFAYSISPSTEEHYVFMSGSEGMPTETLPEGTLTCNNLTLNDEAVKIINQNAGSRQMYVLIQRPNDYLMMPIYSATQMKRVGSFYLLVGSKYTFAIDTMRLSYTDNLQGETSPTIIRFSGSELSSCRYQYKFHGDPARNYVETADFDFIFGIGIINTRHGANATELQQNELRLIGVNGMTYDNYLTSLCRNSVQQSAASSSASKWSNWNTEQNKEDWTNTGNVWNPTTYSTKGMTTNCSETPGAGYHIVQPKESLKAIARTYNVDLKSIIKWNDIKNPDHIEICQKIWLQKPPTITTSKGDTPATYNYQPNAGGPTVFNQSIYWNNGQVNANNNPNQNSFSAPATYNYQNTYQNTTHTVKSGETLISISRRYSCAEKCIRQANNMAAQGDVLLRIGQVLTIPDCSCQTTTIGSSSAVQPTTYSRTSSPQMPAEIANALGNRTQPPGGSWPSPASSSSAPPPVVYNDYTNTNPGSFQETSVAGQNLTSRGNNQPGNNNQEQPPTQEYTVRQGETMQSIAIKFRMSTSELANLNSFAQDEKLIAGKRVVVRNYQNQN